MDSSPPGSVKKRRLFWVTTIIYHCIIPVSATSTPIVVDKNSWKHYGSLRILHYKI